MTREQIIRQLSQFGDYAEADFIHPLRKLAFDRFCVAMEHNNYGGPETLDAWIWFFDGWTQCKLNYGSHKGLDEALNSGKGVYKP